ncbi:unnamed protein product [Coffea canephora]|uniref:Uncharacterized protein n=1 Tax=Coffea canephora TaxID=49390 RepID=A0A068VBL8_COFCA|nr:unnamed protein product [Coffea canephora]
MLIIQLYNACSAGSFPIVHILLATRKISLFLSITPIQNTIFFRPLPSRCDRRRGRRQLSGF